MLIMNILDAFLGVPIETIIRATGLTQAQIEEL